MNKEKIKKLIKDYKNGTSVKELVIKYNRNNVRIREILREYGFKMNSKKSKLAHIQWEKSLQNPGNKAFRKNLLNQHDNLCDRCGVGRNLQIHHNEYIYSNDIKEDSYSVLCTKCHGSLHKELRKKENYFKGDNNIKRAVLQILRTLKIDPNDENFRNTPTRVARMYREMCEGLDASKEIDDILSTKFPTDNKDMVISKNIETYSLCPHHLMPVKYKIHVGIIFKRDCIGLSKIPRLVELLAKRPILQEQLTQEIIDILNNELDLLGVICIIEGVHSCMQARGIKAIGTSVVTSAVKGVFLKAESGKNPKLEFLRLIGK